MEKVPRQTRRDPLLPPRPGRGCSQNRNATPRLRSPAIGRISGDLPHPKTIMSTDRLKEVLTQAREETAKVIIGQSEVIESALIVIFTGNHALIAGVPGVPQTLLVRTLAHVLATDFAR